MIIKSNQVKATEIYTDGGKPLYLFAPGYFLNKDLYSVYQKIGQQIEYSELLAWMRHKYIGDATIIENQLKKALGTLYQRDLLTCDNLELDNYDAQIERESALTEKYGFFPITQIDIIVTKRCNFNCKHCYLDFEEKITENIDIEKWIQACDKLSHYGLQSVVITGGEPLTCSNLITLIIHLLQKNIKVIMLTNGYLFDKSFIDALQPYKKLITIQVSLDGSNPTSHDHQRNKQGAFEVTTQNVRLLKENGICVVLSMVLSDFNSEDILDGSMFMLARDLGVDMLGITPHIIKNGNAIDSNIEIDEYKLLDIVDFVHNYEFDDSFPIITISGPPSITKELSLSHLDINRPRCRRGINSFAIRPDGRIVTCSDFAEIHYNEYDYGNIFETDFPLIIRKAKEVQESIMRQYSRIKGVCSVCTALKNCGGACRADAYAEYGDILAPYPLCQKLFEKGCFPPGMVDNLKEYKNV